MSLVSIVTPVYNVEKYLERCIQSILDQTFNDFELILVDDGSTDNCALICDLYAEKDNRIVVIHKENGGLSSARNAGLDYIFKKSDSKYISFIDSDDFIDTLFLEKLIDNLEKYDVDISLCYCTNIDDHDCVTKFTKSLDKIVIYDKDKYSSFISYSFYGVVAWNKIYKKDIFKDLRFPLGRLREDEYVAHRILANVNTVCVSTKRLYFYRTRDKSIMSKQYSEKLIKDLLFSLEDRLIFFELNSMPKEAFIYLFLYIVNYYYLVHLNCNINDWKKNKRLFIALRRSIRKVKTKIVGLKWKISFLFFSFFPNSISYLFRKKRHL